MSAIKKEDLERMEQEFGLTPDGLSYQHRCSRIAAYQAGIGEQWKPPEKQKPTAPQRPSFEQHPLYGKTILISPLMTPDANRAFYYEEDLGPADIVATDASAGQEIQGMGEDTQRLVRDYDIVHVSSHQRVYAKTTLPKINTELTFTPGRDLAVVCRGNDGQRGYVWSFPVQDIQVNDSIIRIYGLKSIIRQVYPEIEEKFSNRPGSAAIMRYIDNVTLAADIPMTHNLIRQARRQREIDRNAGIIY